MNHRSNYIALLACGIALSIASTGCAQQEKTVLERKAETAGLNRPGGPTLTASFGAAGAPASPMVSTLGSGTADQSDTPNNGKLDLLFVIDDAQEPPETQAFLRQRVPPLVRAFADRTTEDGPVRDLHVGVVSTDMGVTGVAMSWPGCNTAGGRDGWLQTVPQFSGACAAMPWPYLTFVAGGRADQLANDFECISSFGTGCGLAQPLEAALKALWPKNYDNGAEVLPPEKNPIMFLSRSADGRYGHGDEPPNLGFARNDPPDGLSTLAIILVTNNEDCSLRSTQGFDAPEDLTPRALCFKNPQNLYDLSRYERGYPALRPGHRDTVLFAAIVGVPTWRVTAEARAEVDWSNESERNEYYDELRDALPRAAADASRPGGVAFTPSCVANAGGNASVEAYPPYRIIEVARSFGENGFVQSICQDDYAPLADMVLERIAAREQP